MPCCIFNQRLQKKSYENGRKTDTLDKYVGKQNWTGYQKEKISYLLPNGDVFRKLSGKAK